MNTVEVLQQYFENSKQYDVYEGTQMLLRTTGETHWSLIPNNKGEFYYVEKEGMPSDNQFVAEVAFSRKAESEKKLFCMYTLWGDSSRKEVMKIDPSIIKEFGEYAAVIVNTPLFLERIQEKAQTIRSLMNSEPVYDFVNYLHKESLPSKTPIGLYKKIQTDSIYQNEFRICFDMKDIIGVYKDFEIEVSDICTPIEAEKLINMSALNITGLKFGRL